MNPPGEHSDTLLGIEREEIISNLIMASAYDNS